jgi:MFS family permease
MSSTSESLRPHADVGWLRDAKVISIVAVAHFASHVYIMLLPPILLLVKDHFDASYAKIAFAITLYNIMSALLQTPAGFLVDRIGARIMLTAGLLLSGVAVCVAALLPGYGYFLIGYALLGIANTVYHPADYSILSATIDGKRMGKAFSIHTFAGYLGSGVTPALVVTAVALWGWNGGFLVAAVLSFAAAVLLIVTGSVLPRAPRRTPVAAKAHDSPNESTAGWSLLLSGPILRNLLFFFCLAMSNGGIQTFAVVSLAALHGTSAKVANIGLSGFLLFSAAGVLLGGIIADRTPHHERVAAVGFAFTSTMAALLGWVDMPDALLIFVMSLGGLLNGMIQPSRDMMVRAVTPPGSFGKVFGFVTTGFNLGGMVAPLTYAWLMDHGQPRMIYAIVIVFILVALVTCMTRHKPQGTSTWTRSQP